MKTAFINGIILDGTENMVPAAGKVILVDDDKISGITEKEETNLEGYNVIDLKGKYILPGLINLHVHTAGSGKPSKKKMNLPLICKALTSCALGRFIGETMVEKNVYTTLMSGTTTIRTVGGIDNFDSAVRNKINNNKKIGPRMLVSDCAISVEGGHMAGSFAYIAHSAKEASDLVDKIALNKPDLIKLMITGGVLDADEIGKPGKLLMPAEYVKAACDRAHELGYKVAAHVEGADGAKVALENGVDTLEHGADISDELLDLFKEHNACQVITISPAIPFALEMPGVMGMTDIAVINSRVLTDGMVKMAKANLENGVKVGLGTDASCSYCTQYGMWRELVLFAKYCGVSPAFAIHTATQINAEIAGIDNITGTIETGKSADFIVVEENPLVNLKTLGDVKTVVMKGKIYANTNLKKYPEVEEAWENVM